MKRYPEHEIGAVGTNSTATANMLKAGPSFAATGENAAVFNAGQADIIIGPTGIVVANAVHGEINPAIAAAITSSRAKIILIPVNHCRAYIAGIEERKVSEYLQEALEMVDKLVK